MCNNLTYKRRMCNNLTYTHLHSTHVLSLVRMVLQGLFPECLFDLLLCG